MKTTGRKALRLFLTAVIILSLPFACDAARRYVIPTWYGYGTLSQNVGVISPYIISSAFHPSMHPGYLPYYLPSQDPAYYSAYRPWNPPGITGPGYYYQTPSGPLVPFWDGTAWVYRKAQPTATPGIPVTSLNLRADPGFGSSRNRDRNVVGSVARGEAVYVLGRNGDWYYVQSASDPRKCGYVYARYIQLEGAFTSAPAMSWPYACPTYSAPNFWQYPAQAVGRPSTGY